MLKSDKYAQLSMVLDADGAIHAAAAVGRGIVYLTNASGEWVQTPLSLPPVPDDRDGSPSIALDRSGSMAVAFERGQCMPLGCSPFQIYLVRNEAGVWSDPEPIAIGEDPSLQLRDGQAYLAYIASYGRSDIICELPVPVDYMTDVSGDWVTERVSRHGDVVKLRLGSDGLPRIMVGSSYCHYLGSKGIYYATTASAADPFLLEPIAGTSADTDIFVDMALDALDRPRAIFLRSADSDTNFYLSGDESGWTSTELDAPMLNAVSLATGADGVAHILAQGSSGTWYLTNRGGNFASQQLGNDLSVWSNAAGIGLDPLGRPHVLFATGDYDQTKPGLWYTVGPAE